MSEPLWSNQEIIDYWQGAYNDADQCIGRLEARIAELEAQLAQTWQPLPDGEYRSVADILGTFSVFGNGAPDAYPVIRQGDNIAMLDMGDAICRLVTQEPTMRAATHTQGS